MRPSPWLTDNADVFPATSSAGTPLRALDLACGRGRHALWLADAGFDVDAVDREADVLADLQRRADALGLAVVTRVCDLEEHGVSLGHAGYDLIAVCRYLHRPLLASIRRALRPGGVLVYETFTAAQAARGRPTNSAFLLQPGELLELVAPLRVVRQYEGEVDGDMLAGVIAR